MYPNQDDWCPYQKKMLGYKDTGRRACDSEGRDQRGGSARQGMSKIAASLRSLERGVEDSPYRPQKEPALDLEFLLSRKV